LKNNKKYDIDALLRAALKGGDIPRPQVLAAPQSHAGKLNLSDILKNIKRPLSAGAAAAVTIMFVFAAGVAVKHLNMLAPPGTDAAAGATETAQNFDEPNVVEIDENGFVYIASESAGEDITKSVEDQGNEENENIQTKIYMLLSADENPKEYAGGDMIWPLDAEYGAVSSGFGERRSPISDLREFHNGFDIPAPAGADIYAVNDGAVLISEYSPVYGNYIVIDHGGGKTTLYGHAGRRLKETGDEVKKGDVIAEVGSTGWATGNHLHFEYAEYGEPKFLDHGDIISLNHGAITRINDINNGLYGWIKINNTGIDYPVVQAANNDYYLMHDFEKKPNRSGAIFADYRNNKDISQNRNTIIYGHNMLDGAMFHSLTDFGTREELFKNGAIEIITEGAVYRYEMFSVREEEITAGALINENDMIIDFDSSEEYIGYLREMQNRSIFYKEIELNADSKIITLATWVNDVTKRMYFIVQGVLVD